MSIINLLKTSATAVCLFCLLAVTEASAQNFISDGSSADYQATCGAVIRMKSNSSAIVNVNTANLGSSTNVIDGVVDWAGVGGAQTVQGLYYSLLYTSGSSTKNVEDGVFVMGGACATFLPGYDSLGIYPYFATDGGRSYTGTFSYGGSDPQNIFGEQTGASGTDFNILALDGGGTKTILNWGSVGTVVNVDLASGTDLMIKGDLYTGTGTSTFAGNTTMDSTAAEFIVGTGAVDFTGDMTIVNGTLEAATTSGDVTIAATSLLTLSGDNSFLDFADDSDLIITGDIINNGNGTNLLFACLSTVTYDGTQNPQLIMPTLTSNPYGNLVLENGAKQGDAVSNYANDIFICTNFNLTGGNFDMYTNLGTLTMQNVAGVVTYGGGTGNEEVIGRMARVMDASASSYLFNNRYTELSLLADANNPTLTTLQVRPGEGSEMAQYDAVSDVDREVIVEHNATNDFSMELAVGYLEAEGPGGFGGIYTQSSIRFNEGNADDIEKIGTGQEYARIPASGANLGQVSLAGILRAPSNTLPNDIDRFASGNDVILRAGPTTFYSIEDGRWTNPNTWDEGTLPSAIDNTEIRTVVYVGIDGPFIGTVGAPPDDTEANNTKAEFDHYGTNPAANTIVIADGTTYPNASLVIGNEDNPVDYIFHTASTSGNSFENRNTLAPSAAFPFAIAKGTAARTDFNGLWLINSLGAGTPGFGTYQISNQGKIYNEGVIEVGE